MGVGTGRRAFLHLYNSLTHTHPHLPTLTLTYPHPLLHPLLHGFTPFTPATLTLYAFYQTLALRILT